MEQIAGFENYLLQFFLDIIFAFWYINNMEMTTDIKAEILGCIKFYLITKHGENAWIAHGLILRDKLDVLDPGMPEDGIPGFIAFSKGKQRLKLLTNRFLTRKLQLNNGFLPDDFIRAIATDLNDDYFGTCSDIKLCKGEAITENYRRNIGGNSCMTGKCADYTLLYEMNPDRFQQLIIRDGNDSARAIVSKLDDGTYFMDRIYSTCSSLRSKMTEYAEQQGWVHKMNYGCRDMTVSDLTFENGHVPYMDTLTHYFIDDDTLTISNSSSVCPDGELTNTDGTLCEDSGVGCYNCGDRVDPDDSYSDDDGNCYCQCCFDELFMYCECCNETRSQDGCTHIDGIGYVCESCLEGNYTACNDCNGYAINDNVFAVQKNECTIYVCENCLSDYVYCEECEEYFDHSKMTETDDGYLCPDCTPVCKECGEYSSELEDDLCPDCSMEKLIEHTK